MSSRSSCTLGLLTKRAVVAQVGHAGAAEHDHVAAILVERVTALVKRRNLAHSPHDVRRIGLSLRRIRRTISAWKAEIGSISGSPRLAELALRPACAGRRRWPRSAAHRVCCWGGWPMSACRCATRPALPALTEDVVKTSEIEGEKLNLESVRSSIARRLGVDIGALAPVDRHVEGVVEMVLDATARCDDATHRRAALFGWHAALFPTGYSGLTRIRVGALARRCHRSDAGRLRPASASAVHFEAPPAARLEAEMARFLAWVNASHDEPALLKAGLAHLWFVTLHPFDDGNGRIARAVGDLSPRPRRRQPAALLQPLGADPARAARLLRDPRTHAERHARCHRVARVVPRPSCGSAIADAHITRSMACSSRRASGSAGPARR